MAEAFIAQYSYNTQIEVTICDLEATRQEAKEGFSDFVTRVAARPSDVGMVTTTPKTTNPFAGTSDTTTQTVMHQPRGQRVFTPLYISLSKALGVLIKKGHLKLLEPRPLPDPLPPKHNLTKYCAFHQ
ncbi:hypothetical protein HYC85_029113 [Camellia sinensis]|uniref:Uncharacterized protein n=1 Tax=Camellia sinensis TaxID=4442 RepID=A0A7J7FX68_CAMSI|nr:hypothetical protein HYC85_029113 [Camellia sinensis]